MTGQGQIQIYRQEFDEGQPSWRMVDTVKIRADGEFRFADLPAGTISFSDPNILIGNRPATAGAPFELPYSLAVPVGVVEPWMMHRDLARISDDVIAEIRNCTTDEDELAFLDELVSDDLGISTVSKRQILDPTKNCGP